MPARSKKNRKPEKKASGSYRIIAGEHRSRRLEFPEVEGLRPTTDRVRETLFNWLGPNIQGARVLDLFAGSGSLGFEAASRGADSVVCVELNKTAAKSLQDNVTLLKAKVQIVQDDALRYLNSPDACFDVVFLDPPFRTGLLQQALSMIEDSSLLTAGAQIYIEHELELRSLKFPSHWKERKNKVAGQVCFRLFSVS